jgi:transposase
MLIVETIGRIRREHLGKGKSIKEIARTLHLSRNTVRRILRSGETAFSYDREVQPRPKLGPWTDELDRLLTANAKAAARERLTLIRIYEALRPLGYEGGYDAVRRYARRWGEQHASATADAYIPLTFAPGEAYQFDWSHEIVVMDGVTTTVKVAHVRLCMSRMMFVRAYPRESQEMVFDAHDRAFAFFRGACERGIYDNLWTSPAQGDPLESAAGMHESIRPVAGQFTPLALMGVRCFWPHNMIGHGGLVVNQALKLRSLPTNHQVSPRIQDGLRFSAEARRSCGGQIVLLTGEHSPGDPCRLIGKRDNRPIKASPRREHLQPLGTAILVFPQSKHDGAGAVNHLTSEIVIGAPAYSAEPRFASSRILARHKANPRRKFPS